MSARPGKGDVLVWCGSPAVLGVGKRVVLEAPGRESGTWVVTILDAGGFRTLGTLTVDVKDLVSGSMA